MGSYREYEEALNEIIEYYAVKGINDTRLDYFRFERGLLEASKQGPNKVFSFLKSY
jgi:hypothetical protein